MDAFWCITIIVIICSYLWKNRKKRPKTIERAEYIVPKDTTSPTNEEVEARRVQAEIDKQRERDIKELQKQGYTDELIAVILPTINNGD